MARPTLQKLKRWFLCSAAAALAVLLLTRPPLLRAAGHWLSSTAAPPTAADYAFVLPGGVETRPFVAAALYRDGRARAVLIPKNRLTPQIRDGTKPLPHEQIARVLVARGVAPDDIHFLDSSSDSTLQDAQALGAFLDRHPQGRVLAVTDEYHVRRAGWLFSRALGDKAQSVALVAAESESWDPDHWWQYRTGLTIFINEYLKLAFYLLVLNPLASLSLAALLLAGSAAGFLFFWRSRPTGRPPISAEPVAPPAP